MDKYIFPTTPQANPKSVIQGATYRFTVLTDRLIRYEWAADGQFEDRASTFAIHRDFPVPEYRFTDGENLDIYTSACHISYTKEKFSPESFVVNFNGSVIKYATAWRFGTHAGNLGGTARTLDGVNGRCDMGDGVISQSGFTTLDDSRSMLFDGQGWVAPRRPGERSDGYLFCYGHDYKGAIKDFYALSGKQPILPRFAFGNWWSRYYAYHQDEYVGLMDKFSEHSIPMSVAVVDMDWHLVSDPRVPHAGWTGYTWNPSLFPDPTRFRKEIHDRRLKITLNDHPHSGVYPFEDSYAEMARAMGLDPSAQNPIVFDPASPVFLHAYLNILHRNLETTACDFWWLDWQQGPWSKIPGFDPLWLLNHFQYLDAIHTHPDAPLIFSRYGGPGSHRYPVGFSGDTIITWASLAFQPEFTATASNIGYGWWSHDIGGHQYGGRDDELATRWVQLGVFSPIMRLHSTTSRWMSKEPWLYRPECQSVMENFMRFRHRLVPYLYTCNVLAAEQDEPLVQPLYWSYPDHGEAYEFRNQYTFGPELMVAPIVQPRDPRTGLAGVKAWLPPGSRYVDLFTGVIYDGDRAVTFYRPLDKYPVLAREGSIIPLDSDAVPANGCRNPDRYAVLVVPGRDHSVEIIEDPTDDPDPASKKDASPSRRTSLIAWDEAESQLKATLTAGKAWTFRFLGVNTHPDHFRVSINDVDQTGGVVTEVTNYPQVPSFTVTIQPAATQSYGKGFSLVVDLAGGGFLRAISPKPLLEELIMQMQVDFEVKNRLWKEVDENRKRRINEIVATLHTLGYEEAIVGPVLELVLANRMVVDLYEGREGTQ